MSKLSAGSLFSLKGNVAFVTGGATGIGLMIAQALSENGCKVWIGGRRLDMLIKAAETYGPAARAAGGSLAPIRIDVTDKDSMKAAIKAIEQTDGFLTLLVNCAGGGMGGISLKNHGKDANAFAADMFAADKDAWQRMHDTNVNSVHFLSAAALPLLVAGRKKFESHLASMPSSIINIASVGGMLQTTFGSLGYQNDKAGIMHLTRVQAKLFGDPTIKVRVNAISPGWFPAQGSGKIDDRNKNHIPDSDPRAVKQTYTGRVGCEADMAMATLSLSPVTAS